MPKHCAAWGCSNRSNKDNVSFHRFPLHRQAVLQLWLHNVRREGFVPSATSVLCGSHFLPECFVTPQTSGRSCLKPDAVPTEFNYPAHLQSAIRRPSLLSNVSDEPPDKKAAVLQDDCGRRSYARASPRIVITPSLLSNISDEPPDKKAAVLPDDCGHHSYAMTSPKKVITLQKATIEKLRGKVRKLNNALRRRNIRIATLEKALNDCKKQSILNDEAHESLNYSFHPVASELILNETRSRQAQARSSVM